VCVCVGVECFVCGGVGGGGESKVGSKLTKKWIIICRFVLKSPRIT